MNVLAISKKIAPVNVAALRRIREIEDSVMRMPQTELPIEQFIYAGCYARTVLVPKGCVFVGTLLKVPTILIVSGHMLLNSGERLFELQGYEVLQGSAFRKQVGRAIEDTYMTMIYATNAKDTDEAEKEFTDEYERLQTRRRTK